MDNRMSHLLVNRSCGFLGMFRVLWGFKFSCAPLFISITVHKLNISSLEFVVLLIQVVLVSVHRYLCSLHRNRGNLKTRMSNNNFIELCMIHLSLVDIQQNLTFSKSPNLLGSSFVRDTWIWNQEISPPQFLELEIARVQTHIRYLSTWDSCHLKQYITNYNILMDWVGNVTLDFIWYIDLFPQVLREDTCTKWILFSLTRMNAGIAIVIRVYFGVVITWKKIITLTFFVWFLVFLYGLLETTIHYRSREK